MEVVATSADSGCDVFVVVESGFAEDRLLVSFPGVVDVVEDRGLVRFAHQFEKECFEEVVLAWPEQQHVVFTLVVVPVSQDEQLALFVDPSLFLEEDRSGQTLLLLKCLLIPHGHSSHIYLCKVILKRVF